MTEQSPAGTPSGTPAADATSGTPAQTTATPPAATATPAQAAPPATAVTGEAKPTDAKPADGDAKPTETPQGAPEKYEFAVPEGMTLEPETTTQFESVARELNLSNDQANKLVPLAAALVQRNLALQQEAHTKQVQQWLEEARTDKELAGEKGEKFDANLAIAIKAVERFGTPPLKQLLDQSGLGNHPEIVRLFHRIGSAIAEDQFVNAPSGGAGKPPLAERMYPNLKK